MTGKVEGNGCGMFQVKVSPVDVVKALRETISSAPRCSYTILKNIFNESHEVEPHICVCDSLSNMDHT
jgi:hypothetical protein